MDSEFPSKTAKVESFQVLKLLPILPIKLERERKIQMKNRDSEKKKKEIEVMEI